MYKVKVITYYNEDSFQNAVMDFLEFVKGKSETVQFSTTYDALWKRLVYTAMVTWKD